MKAPLLTLAFVVLSCDPPNSHMDDLARFDAAKQPIESTFLKPYLVTTPDGVQIQDGWYDPKLKYRCARLTHGYCESGHTPQCDGISSYTDAACTQPAGFCGDVPNSILVQLTPPYQVYLTGKTPIKLYSGTPCLQTLTQSFYTSLEKAAGRLVIEALLTCDNN